VLFEHAWMGRGAERAVASVGLALGGKALGVPAAV
jgi:hypothetical protein